MARKGDGEEEVGGRLEAGRRQDGGISLKRALEGEAESGILESGFKDFGIQIVFI